MNEIAEMLDGVNSIEDIPRILEGLMMDLVGHEEDHHGEHHEEMGMMEIIQTIIMKVGERFPDPE